MPTSQEPPLSAAIFLALERRKALPIIPTPTPPPQKWARLARFGPILDAVLFVDASVLVCLCSWRRPSPSDI